MDGFINLLKPAGMTSHDAVSAIRRIFRMKKVGHTGTLDPMACGVLSICLGSGTRAAEYLESDDKAYRCELMLGTVTDTGDIWGNVTGGDPEAAKAVTRNQVKDALLCMQGEQLQYPPMYSAIRKNGKHLYEYARKGETVDVEPRRINLYSITPVHVLDEPGRVMFDVVCSKGTYVRTICTDLGERLGCGATMTFLTRTRSGAFHIDDAVTLEEMLLAIEEADGIEPEETLAVKHTGPMRADLGRYVRPVDEMLPYFGSATLDAAQHRLYVNGGKIAKRNASIGRENSLPRENRFCDMFLMYGPEGFCGTARLDRGTGVFTAGKVLFR